MAEMGKLIDIVEAVIDKDQQRMRDSMELFDRYYQRMMAVERSSQVTGPDNQLDWVDFV